MDLSDPQSEKTAAWITRNYEANPGADSLVWRVPTADLYHGYLRWARGNDLTRLYTIEHMWEILQILWPNVKIVGKRGSRAYTGIRKR